MYITSDIRKVGINKVNNQSTLYSIYTQHFDSDYVGYVRSWFYILSVSWHDLYNTKNNETSEQGYC